MNIQKENKTEQEQLLNAFNDVLKVVLNGISFNKTKNDYLSECCFYALKLKKLYNRDDVFHTLLIKNHLYQLKQFFEYVGIFFNAKKENKTDIFLKVVVDVDGLFKKCSDIESLVSYKDFLKEQKENKEPPAVDYKKRLTTLFKNKNKTDIESILKDFLKTLKQ